MALHHGPMTERAIFLLGAGASHDAGLPLASDLTGRVLNAQIGSRREQAALNYVVGAIIGHRSKSGVRPNELPDIETVISAIELLATRGDLEVAPFVTWDAAVGAQAAPTHAESSVSLADGVKAALGEASGPRVRRPDGQPLLDAVERIAGRVAGVGLQEPYHRLKSNIMRLMISELAVKDPTRLSYLNPLLDYVRSIPSPDGVIATLNYDVSVEEAARWSGCPVDQGVEGWTRTGAISWHPDSVRLIKLHGSLDWRRDDLAEDGEFGRVRLGRSRGPDDPREPLIVLGRREKLRPEGPSLQLLEAFRDALLRASALVVIGYRFGDSHINALVGHWLDCSHSRHLIVVDPEFPDSERPGAWLDGRVRLAAELERDGERMTVVRMTAASFLAGMQGDPCGYAEVVGLPT